MKLKMLCALPLVLFGCAEKPETKQQVVKETAPATQVAASQPASQLPSDAPNIVVATTGKGAPLSYRNEAGVLDGIDIDVLRAVGEHEGFRTEFVQAEWKTMFDEVNAGKYDVAVAGISWTEERAGKYSLSDSYLLNPAAVIYKADGAVQPKTLADLTSVKVGILAGSSYEKLLKDAGATNLVEAKSGFEGFAEFMKGGTDAYVNSELRLKHSQGSYPDIKLVVQPLQGEEEKSANLVMVVNPNKPELLEKINAGIVKVKADGTVAKAVEKHLAILPVAEQPK